jgi:hypothetical protein
MPGQAVPDSSGLAVSVAGRNAPNKLKAARAYSLAPSRAFRRAAAQAGDGYARGPAPVRAPLDEMARALHGGVRNVPLAADYPFLDVIWTMLIFFLAVIWIWLLIKVFAELIFRRHELSVFAKACWLIFVMVLPFLGVFVYLIVNDKPAGEPGSTPAQH